MEQDMIGSWLADTYAVDTWRSGPSRSSNWTPTSHVLASVKRMVQGNHRKAVGCERAWAGAAAARLPERRSAAACAAGLAWTRPHLPANHPSGSNNDDGYTRWH
jgi:hypothetical protein